MPFKCRKISSPLRCPTCLLGQGTFAGRALSSLDRAAHLLGPRSWPSPEENASLCAPDGERSLAHSATLLSASKCPYFQDARCHGMLLRVDT